MLPHEIFRDLATQDHDAAMCREFIDENKDLINYLVGKVEDYQHNNAWQCAGMIQNDPAHDWDHVARVFMNAWRIRRAENLYNYVDLQVVLVAAIGHDLVNHPKDSHKRAMSSTDSSIAMSQILRDSPDLGFDEKKISAIGHAIASHSFSSKLEACTIEAKVLQDADRLDSLGYIGLSRMFIVSGHMKRQTANQRIPRPVHAVREPNDQKYALDHVYTKLQQLPGLMNYNYSRERALRLHQVMIDFVDGYAKELVV